MQRRSDLTMTDADLLALKGQLIKMEYQYEGIWYDSEVGIVTDVDLENDEITIIQLDGYNVTWGMRGTPNDSDNLFFTTLED